MRQSLRQARATQKLLPPSYPIMRDMSLLCEMDGQINTDMQEHIVRQLIESLLKFRFDR